MSTDWNEYRRRLEESVEPVLWQEPQELSRLSLETLFGEFSPIRRDRSSGFIRFTGGGINGTAARVDHVADAMKNFQRLVLATGASLEGFKTLRGKVPAQYVSRTNLHLQGSALPGSLILELAPEFLPSQEIVPDGQAPLFGDTETTQLVDRAIVASLELLQLSKSVGADADESAFLGELAERGPRVATTLRDLASSLVDAQFDTEIAWEQPRAASVRTKMTVPQLQQLGLLVASRELEKEPIVLRGLLRTVSDIGPWKVEVNPGEVETVDASGIAAAVTKTMSVGTYVEVKATVTEDASPGGASVTHYAATEITVIAGPRE